MTDGMVRARNHVRARQEMSDLVMGFGWAVLCTLCALVFMVGMVVYQSDMYAGAWVMGLPCVVVVVCWLVRYRWVDRQ